MIRHYTNWYGINCDLDIEVNILLPRMVRHEDIDAKVVREKPEKNINKSLEEFDEFLDHIALLRRMLMSRLVNRSFRE